MRSKRLFAVVIAVVLAATLISGATLALAAGKGKGAKPEKPGKDLVQPPDGDTTATAVKNKHRNRELIVNRILERRNAFLVKGRALEMTDTQLTVQIQLATGVLKDRKGETVTVVLTPETTIFGLGESGFEPGSYVIVYGFGADELTASKVVFLPFRWVALNGQVTSVGENSFTMMVKTSNRLVRDLRGTEVEVLISDETVFSSPTSQPVELEPGMYVNVFGYTRGGSIHAKKVVIKAKPYEETTPVVQPEESTPTTDAGTGDTTEAVSSEETTATSSTTTPVFSAEKARKAFETIIDEIRQVYRNLFGFLKRLFWRF